jgi:DNA-binding LacI/PurR family transcriptional regulator
MIFMNHMPNKGEFKVLKLRQGAQEQITDYLRGEIYQGNLKPGIKLPATQELAVQWGTHTATVHKAMEPLVKEGLLVRMPRLGTFVREREEKLTCVGVYGDYEAANAQNTPYAQAVRQALRDELQKDGIEVDLWMDPRPQSQQGEPWKPLLRAAEQRRFQAFIGVELNLPLLEWQRKLPVPAAFLGAPLSVANNVDHDMRQFVEISLRELARQGCRSVGFIAPIMDADKFMDPEGSPNVYYGMMEHFTAIARDLDLTVKNEWMRLLPPGSGCSAGIKAQEQFGYEEFLKLWSQPEKPEGLVVFTDVTVRGAIVAIREKQVRVPGELKLMLHKCESTNLFCPMPATFVVNSEREMAQALIGQVKKQFRGESCERISLPFKLVAHENL